MMVNIEKFLSKEPEDFDLESRFDVEKFTRSKEFIGYKVYSECMSSMRFEKPVIIRCIYDLRKKWMKLYEELNKKGFFLQEPIFYSNYYGTPLGDRTDVGYVCIGHSYLEDTDTKDMEKNNEHTE